jgi:hypothetical protein
MEQRQRFFALVLHCVRDTCLNLGAYVITLASGQLAQ